MCGTQKEFLTIFIKRNNTMAMKKKGYAKGGSVKKPPKKPAMTLAQIRAAAKAKGYKLVKIT